MKRLDTYKIRLKIGDTVVVRSGKLRGKTGKITATHPRLNAVTVEGLNIVKRRFKATPGRRNAGEVEITRPLAVSKVGLLAPGANKPSRVGIRLNKQGDKTRFYKLSGKEVA